MFLLFMFLFVVFIQSSWSSFMSPFTLQHSMISRYALGSLPCIDINQVFSNQIVILVDFSYNHLKTNTTSCSSVATVRVRLANQSAVLVTRGGSESTLRSGTVTLWHITWAAALAVALGTAEISGQSLHTDGFLIGFRSQSLGCRSEWGWLPRPPATCNVKGKMPKIAENQCIYPVNSV